MAFAVLFWISLALVAYAYVGYALLVCGCARLWGRRPTPPNEPPAETSDLPTVNLLIAALNEEQVIAERLDNALASDYPSDKLQVVIASDGSTDQTAAIVRDYEARFPGRVRLLDYSVRRGKATALNTSIPQLDAEVIVLSDANTFFERGAIRRLVRWFSDETIGTVCGKLHLLDPKSGKNVDGWYWRYETFLKRCEGQLGALLGANGAIYAIRRSDFLPIPPDTIIDDFYLPLLIKLRRGKRIEYDAAAIAHEHTPETVHDEFRRRTRIGAGGFQSLVRLWPLLLPRYGWTSFAFLSHKLLRWLCPLFMALMLASNAMLVREPLYTALFAGQCVFYAIAIAGSRLPGTSSLVRAVRLVTMFVTMNLALAVGFCRWIAGLQRGTWQRTAR
jgi:cellulose synthase/poly-beta-1,6-N-acetylglucosamine synthase-like glycosyltransferase